MIPILANAGVPMIFLALPPMIILLIPIILIEGWSSIGIINGIDRKQIWSGVIRANLFSTFIAWPVAWFLMVVLQMIAGGGAMYGLDSPLKLILAVTIQAPWLIPYEAELYWMIPVAMFVLLFPFFFVSVFAERYILLKLWKDTSNTSIIRFSWKSHLYSYLFLMIVVALFILYSVMTEHNQSG